MKGVGIKDRQGRRINYLRVSVTDRCNLRCVYCMPPEGVEPVMPAEILSYEEILRVVRLSVELGITKVRVTGGEPLVRQNLVEFVGMLSSIPGIEDLSLTTNGMLLAPVAEQLRANGLTRVNISLDTLDPETFKRITNRDGLSRVLAGIDAALAAGLTPVKVNVVAMRGVNDGEILDFAEFAADKGVQVRFIEYMPSRRDEWSDAKMVPGSEIISRISTRYELAPVNHAGAAPGPGRVYDFAAAGPEGKRRGSVGIISALSNHFCSSCNRLRLTADGRLRGCLFSAEELDLKSLLREGAPDAAISAVLTEAVEQKPERHKLNDVTADNSSLAMNRIGG